MAHYCGTANTSKVTVVNIDRLPKPDVSSCPDNRSCSAPISFLCKKSAPRLRRPLQDLAHTDQFWGRLQSKSLQELHFSATCPFKASQEEQIGMAQTIPLKYADRSEQYEDFREVTHHQKGRLLKARLKPQWPVPISGPTVAVCQGMMPERIQYHPTLEGQSRRQHRPPGGASLQLHKPSDTIHYTSLASLPGPRAK